MLTDCCSDETESYAWNSYARHGSFVTIDEDDEEDAECQGGCHDVARGEETEKEHIAGPNCELDGKGYSGWRIRAEEMRVGQFLKMVKQYKTVSLTITQERTWMQCLHAKDDQWSPESGDEDFEIAAKHCFVTGISKQGVSEFDVEGIRPVKHGIENCAIYNLAEEMVSFG